MPFMEKQVTRKLLWYAIDTESGVWFIPAEDVDGGKLADAFDGGFVLDVDEFEHADTFLQYTEGSKLQGISVRLGYGARLSAPGYLDCTEWSVFDTVKDAEEYLDSEYSEEDETE